MAETSAPPTGTVTFVFTDIEGSTAMWERAPTTMPAVLARHDELMREAIDRHGGYVFATRGHGYAVALIVTLEAPTLNAGLWDTGGQDWAVIGRFATVVFAEMPLDPTIYPDNEQAEQLVQWAVSQIDRRKLMLLYTADGIDSAKQEAA